MPYAKLHDGYESHAKTQLVDLTAGTAIALHCKALAHCARQLSDGHVSDAWIRGQLASLRPRQREQVLAYALDVGLFEADQDGFRVHDYLDYNDSRTEVEKKRASAARRQQDARDRARQSSLPWAPERATT